MKDNLIISVSSHNNYVMLENDVLKNIDCEGFEFINIDDDSTEDQRSEGRWLCDKNEIVYIQNKKKGVQFAVDTLMDFVGRERKKCKWILLFQHDNYPITPDFFKRLSELFDRGVPEEIAAFGFNNLDSGDYTGDSMEVHNRGEFATGIMGKMHLQLHGTNRWVAPKKNPIVKNEPELFKTPFSIEIPLEASLAINVKKWNTVIKPTTDYEFHLWFPDVMMQFLYHGFHCVILPELYCMNHQDLKVAHGFAKSSAHGAQNGQEDIYGEYGPHLKAWKKRWGWDYENTGNFSHEAYKGTLLAEFKNHDFAKAKQHLYTFNIDY